MLKFIDIDIAKTTTNFLSLKTHLVIKYISFFYYSSNN